MKPRTRLLIALAAGLATAVLPSYLTGTSLDLSQTTLGFRALPLFFAAGLVTALTPCVYPLIPITVSIFGAGRARRSRGHAASLSATYVLGIATMYSSLGLISAASGRAFGTYLSHPAVGIVFALIMGALAASMFGAFDLTLPAGLQARLSGVAGFGFGSAFLMGLVCGIVAAPCTGPALLATLTYVAKSGDMWLGFWLLFTYALGLGSPFFVLGTFTVSLPKSGAWMEAVKSGLGILLVLVALSFLQPFLPKPLELGLGGHVIDIVAGAAVFLAIVAGTLDWSFHGAVREIVMKGAGVAVVVGAIAFRLGWIVEPAAVAATPSLVASAMKVPEKIAWLTDEAAALAQSKTTGKPVLIDFGASWCASCMELEHHTYTDPRVRAKVTSDFVPLKIDASDENDQILAIEKKYNVLGLPLVTFVDRSGRQLSDPKVVGFMKPSEFLGVLARVPVQ